MGEASRRGGGGSDGKTKPGRGRSDEVRTVLSYIDKHSEWIKSLNKEADAGEDKRQSDAELEPQFKDCTMCPHVRGDSPTGELEEDERRETCNPCVMEQLSTFEVLPVCPPLSFVEAQELSYFPDGVLEDGLRSGEIPVATMQAIRMIQARRSPRLF